jgi:hypothetical protein
LLQESNIFDRKGKINNIFKNGLLYIVTALSTTGLKGHIGGRIQAFSTWKAILPLASYHTPAVFVGGIPWLVEVRLNTRGVLLYHTILVKRMNRKLDAKDIIKEPIKELYFVYLLKTLKGWSGSRLA